LISGHEDLVGQKYEFDDGNSLEVIQLRWRGDEDFLVTYHVHNGPGIPRKLILPLQEFLGTYGYLFGRGEPPEPRQ
jgi:hypothetical protein